MESIDNTCYFRRRQYRKRCDTMKSLLQFIKMSKYAGAREDLVQAGGGNSSYKYTQDRMIIKASGCQLADVTEDTGYAVVDHKIIKEAFLDMLDIQKLSEEKAKEILSRAFIRGGKPSIETFLHAISDCYSLHTHPIIVNALACREDGGAILQELFPESLIVPYATPGIELAKQYFSSYKIFKESYKLEPEIIFFMNHGLLVSAPTADKAVLLTEYVTEKIENYLGVDFKAYHEATLLQEFFENGIVWKVNDGAVLDFQKKIGNIWKHYFCPDCVVFLGKEMYEIKDDEFSKEDWISFTEKNIYPVIISYHDHLYIHADSVRKAMEIQSVLSFSAQVMLLNYEKNVVFLSEQEKDFLLNWDAEKYRNQMR